MSATDLQARVQSLASKLDNIDTDAARRLRDIAEAIEDAPRRRELAYLDIRSILDPQGVEERAIAGRRPVWLNFLEWFRNVLVLFPIAFTWIGLSRASANYSSVVTQNPDLINQPFLLLWERGFQELGTRHGPTFSELALIDFLVLGVVIGLTIVVHRWRDVQEVQAEKNAAELRSEAEQVIWDLDQRLAVERSNQDVSQAAQKVGDAVERFRVHANELLDLMLAERRRLEGTATMRERELADLQAFSEAATKLTQYGQSVEHVYDRLQASVDRFTDEIQKAGQQQDLLVKSLDSADVGSHQMAEAVRTLRQSLVTAVSELGNAASRSGDNVVGVTAAIAEMRDLASRLVEEDTALRRALLESREANREITKNLQAATGEIKDATSATQLAASTLRQAVNELVKLTQASGDLAHQLSQSAGQMSHVAEDLGVTTYQATSQLKNTTGVNQQAVATLSQVANELTKVIQSNGDLAHQLSQSAGQMSRISEHLSLATGTTVTAFRELQPVAGDLRGAIGLLSQETKRLSEMVGNTQQAGVRLLRHAERPSQPSLGPRSLLFFAGFGVVFGLGFGAAVYLLALLGVLPVLR